MDPLVGETRARRLSWATRLLGWALLLTMVPLFGVLSWAPFELDPPVRAANNVSQLDDVWMFDGPSRLSMRIDAEDLRVRSFAFDIRFPCGRAEEGGRVLTFSRSWGRPLLVIDQIGDRLVVSGALGTEPVAVRGTRTGQACGEWRTVELRYSHNDLVVHGPGRPEITTLVLDMLSTTDRIDVGTPLVGNDHWKGEIRRLELRTAGGSTAPDDVRRPTHLWVLPTRLLGSSERGQGDLVVARMLHAVGGMLLGFGLVVSFRGQPFRRCLVAGVVFTALLNVGKVFVAYRHPSFGAALLQIGGFGTGATIGRLLGFDREVDGEARRGAGWRPT